MGINITAGNKATVSVGRDMIAGQGREMEAILAFLSVIQKEQPAKDRDIDAIRNRVEELAATEDTLTREGLLTQIMDLAAKLGPAVVTALAELLPLLFAG